MSKKLVLIVLLISISGFRLFAQFIFLGPMLHVDFDAERKMRYNLGLEISFWQGDQPFGFDVGIQFPKNKIRLYSELEFGAIGGGAVGLVSEFSKDKKPRIGMQASIWACYFIGKDIRIRYFGEKLESEAGVFVKAPLLYHPTIGF